MTDSHSISNTADCRIVTLSRHHHDEGNLTVADLPYQPQRVYYLYDVPCGEERGGHSHRECTEFLVAVAGSFSVEVSDGKNTKVFHLNRPDRGLLIPAGIWRVLNNFSSGSVCLVLASHKYDEADYVREYAEFQQLTKVKL